MLSLWRHPTRGLQVSTQGYDATLRAHGVSAGEGRAAAAARALTELTAHCVPVPVLVLERRPRPLRSGYVAPRFLSALKLHASKLAFYSKRATPCRVRAAAACSLGQRHRRGRVCTLVGRSTRVRVRRALGRRAVLQRTHPPRGERARARHGSTTI